MSLKEQALAIQVKLAEIEKKCYEIAGLLALVLTERKVGGDTFSFSQANKQKLIQHYQTKKGELEALVEALP